MLDPLKVAIDHNLVVLGLATYVVGTLVLIGYFLLRTPLLNAPASCSRRLRACCNSSNSARAGT